VVVAVDDLAYLIATLAFREAFLASLSFDFVSSVAVFVVCCSLEVLFTVWLPCDPHPRTAPPLLLSSLSSSSSLLFQLSRRLLGSSSSLTGETISLSGSFISPTFSFSSVFSTMPFRIPGEFLDESGSSAPGDGGLPSCPFFCLIQNTRRGSFAIPDQLRES